MSTAKIPEIVPEDEPNSPLGSGAVLFRRKPNGRYVIAPVDIDRNRFDSIAKLTRQLAVKVSNLEHEVWDLSDAVAKLKRHLPQKKAAKKKKRS